MITVIILILSYVFIPNVFFTYDVENPACFLHVVGAPECNFRKEFNGISSLFIIIISYILSCLIFWIYDKLKKK